MSSTQYGKDGQNEVLRQRNQEINYIDNDIQDMFKKELDPLNCRKIPSSIYDV